MDAPTYTKIVDRLGQLYGANGLPLYERDSIPYPLSIIPISNDLTPDNILSAAPPTNSLTRDDLVIYDETPIITAQSDGRSVYNGVTFAFDRLEHQPIRFYAKLGTYFDHMATCVALEAELLAGDALPLRDELHDYLPPAALMSSGAGRSAAVGVNTLLIYRNADGAYRTLFTQRSAKTAHKPGALHVIPAFTFQPSRADYPAVEWSLSRQIRREYLEELYNITPQEAGGGAASHPAGLQLDAMLSDGRAELILTGITANLMTTHVSICTVLLIHEPIWYEQFQMQTQAMWETQQVFTLPIQSDAALLAALPKDAHRFMAPNGAAALWLGVDLARTRLKEGI